MTGPRRPDANDLHALADGQLDPARAAEMTAALAELPEARCVADYQRINTGLHALYDHVLEEPAPERLLNPPRASSWRARWAGAGYAAAALALLVVGATGGWYARDSMIKSRQEQIAMVRPAAIAHIVYAVEKRHPVEVGADEEEHLVRWLSNRLKHQLKVPKLDTIGFKLVGGRLLPGESGTAAQFMYENAQGRRMTLYVRADINGLRETAFRYGDEGGVGVFYWIDGPMGYAITGQFGREELLGIARKVYEQLEG